MPRIVKEHAVRRNEILDAAQRLIYTRGYEQMSMQDIINELQIAKGTVYYYFESKQMLLEAIIERMLAEVEKALLPIVHDSNLNALEKFQKFFMATNRYRNSHIPFMLKLLRVWYSDTNALVRQKTRVMTVKLVIPWLSEIVHQGIREGSLATPYPDQAGEIVMALRQGLEESITEVLLSNDPDDDRELRIEYIIAAYTETFEHVLGAPKGSLHPIDVEATKKWVALLKEVVPE